MAGLFSIEQLRKGIGAAVTVASSAVSKAAEAAKDLAEDLTSFKGLKDYRLTGHVASAGPGGAAWKIFSAVNKKPGAMYLLHGAVCARACWVAGRGGCSACMTGLGPGQCAATTVSEDFVPNANTAPNPPPPKHRRGVPRGVGVDSRQKGARGAGQQGWARARV